MKMNRKLLVGIGLGIGLAFAADYTVPKSWTRTGAEYARSATTIFDPLNTDTPTMVRVRIKRVASADDEAHEWTEEKVSQLPNAITVNGSVTTNVFKSRMQAVFTRVDIVRAYNWALRNGFEAAMVPVPPPGAP